MIKSLIEKINKGKWAVSEPIFRDDFNWQYNLCQLSDKADAMGISLFSELPDEDEVCSYVDESVPLLDAWVQVCTWSVKDVGIEFIRHLESIDSIDELKSAIKQAYDKDAINLVKFMVALLCKAEAETKEEAESVETEAKSDAEVEVKSEDKAEEHVNEENAEDDYDEKCKHAADVVCYAAAQIYDNDELWHNDTTNNGYIYYEVKYDVAEKASSYLGLNMSENLKVGGSYEYGYSVRDAISEWFNLENTRSFTASEILDAVKFELDNFELSNQEYNILLAIVYVFINDDEPANKADVAENKKGETVVMSENVEVVKSDIGEMLRYKGYNLEKGYLLSRHRVVFGGEEHTLDEYSVEGILVNPSIELETGFVIELASGLKNADRVRLYLSKYPSNKQGRVFKSLHKNGEWTDYKEMTLSPFGGTYGVAPRYLVMSQVCFGCKEKHASENDLSSYIGYHRMLGLLMAKHSGELIQMRDKSGGCIKNLSINHMDNDGFNNRIDNLELTTSGLNTAHYEVVNRLYELDKDLFVESSVGKQVLRYGLSIKTIINYLAYRNLGKIVDYDDFLQFWIAEKEKNGGVFE